MVKSNVSPHPFLEVLCQRFPKTFNLSARKPLKIGIAQDVLTACADDPKCTKSSAKRALRYYVMGRGYLLALVSGTNRIDLEGNGAGEVSPEDQLHAEKLLAIKVIYPAPATEP